MYKTIYNDNTLSIIYAISKVGLPQSLCLMNEDHILTQLSEEDKVKYASYRNYAYNNIDYIREELNQ